MWLTLPIFCCYQFVTMNYTHFVEKKKHMEKKDRVEKQEKFRRTNSEGKLRKLSETRER